MTHQDITILRLHNQRINGSEQTPAEIADYMGALQAQDYYNSIWALGLRTHKTEHEICQTLEERRLIRTWPQRGTIHFVAAKNARWQVELSASRLLKGATRRHQNLSLDEDTFELGKQTLTRALRGNVFLTRPQVLAVLEDAGIATGGGRGYHMLWYLSQTGVIYIGPMHAKQQTFGLLDELVPRPEPLSREESIIQLAKRYFTSHGPATIQDFMWWSGLTATDAKDGLEANDHLLECSQVDGKGYWLPKDQSNPSIEHEAFLLPGFDEYLLGYKDRSAALPIHHATKVVPGNNGIFLPSLVIRGQVVGTWKRSIKRDHVLLNISPFEPLNKRDIELLERPLKDYERFIGPRVQVEMT